MAGLAYSGAASNRFLADWTAQLTDSNDDWWRDAPTLAARSWHLYDNDPYFHALVETLVGGVFGATGLRFRSLYQEDTKPETSDREREVRREIDKAMTSACNRKRLDAIGLLSWRDMSAMIYRSALVAGDGFAVRTWKPERVDAYQATCWRIIDPARVSNPNFAANTEQMFEGFELDGDGRPVAIYVQKSHPNLQRVAMKFDWQRVPIFAPDGSRNVMHRKRVKRPEQIRGLGCAAPVLVYLRMLGQTTEAWVIAKRIQASYALMVKTDDPSKAAAADKYGALLTGNSPTKPGMRYYHNHESITPLDYQFQGNDYEQFRNPIIEAVCATECVPFEMVLQRLTKSNLASSRAALLSYYTTCQREQDGQIEDVEQIRVEAVLREEVARDRLTVSGDNWDEITAGRFLRPPRVWPDPLKEANAARAWIDLGRSLSSVYAEAGLDFESEILQRAQDDKLLEAQGISISEATPGAPIVTEPKEDAAGDSADAGTDPADEQDPDEPAAPANA